MFRKIPKGTNWFYTLGSATMFAFLNQAITGVFLAMYYDPSPTRAYESVRFITNEAFLGEFVRGMHKWGSTVMIVLIFLHMARTFFFGAYKYPRELNWVIGVALVILTFVMGLTGYLLPFDQRSYWATIVANNITAHRPAGRPLPGRLPARRPGLRRHDALALLRDPHAAGPGGASARSSARTCTSSPSSARPRRRGSRPRTRSRCGRKSHEQAREGGVPPRLLAAEGQGEAVLPLRGRQGRGDGVRGPGRHHHDVDRARRRARPEGRPDDDDLHAAARSGTSSSSSSCCASSSRPRSSSSRPSASRRSA